MTRTAAALFGVHAEAARTRRRLTQEELAASQRGRLLQAVVEVAARKGYVAATIADIVAAAAVSRNTFYDHFADKHECFLAALDTGGGLVVDEVLAVAPEPDDWAASTRARVRVALRALEDSPALARALLLEAPSAGVAAHRLVTALNQRLAQALHAEQQIAIRHDDRLPDLPPAIFTAVTGGITELIRSELLADAPRPLTALEDDLTRFLRIVHDARPG